MIKLHARDPQTQNQSNHTIHTRARARHGKLPVTCSPSHVLSRCHVAYHATRTNPNRLKPKSTASRCLALSLSPFISPSIYAIAIWAKPPPSMATHCSAGASSGAWTLHGEGSHSLRTGRLASPSVDVDGGLAR